MLEYKIMNIEDIIDRRIAGRKNKDNQSSNRVLPVNLNGEVDKLIQWYYKNLVKGHYTEIGEYHFPTVLRNLIEKVAVWYELRYPSYEVNRILHCCGQEQIIVNNVMFKNNKYICDLFDEKSDVKDLDFADFYNKEAFLKSLPAEERMYLLDVVYNDLVYIDLQNNCKRAHLHLNPENGNVVISESVKELTNSIILDEELVGLNIRDVKQLFKQRNIKLTDNNELEKTVKYYDNWSYLYDGVMDSIMYRIIERGGNRIGPRRAFLFAKEFGRSIDIPMKYGVDRSDPGLRSFMNEYLKAGGSKELVCYVNYFSRSSEMDKVDTVTVQELIRTRSDSCINFYTSEEHELHEKLATVIARKVDQEYIRHRTQKN